MVGGFYWREVEAVGTFRGTIFFLSVLCIALLLASTGRAERNPDRMRAAEERAQIKDFDGALEIYESILDENPDDVDALNGKGRVLAWMGSSPLARETFREVLEISPENREALMGIAESYALEWKYGKAIKIVEELRRKWPGDRDLLISLGKYNLLSGKKEDALYFSRKALEIDSGNREALEIQSAATRLNRYDTLFGYKYLNITNNEDGHNIYGTFRYHPGKSYSLYGSLGYLDRFNEGEGRISGGGAYTTENKLQLSGEVSLSPGGDVYPRYSGWVEFASPVISSWIISGNLGYAHFGLADDYSLSVTGEYYPYGYLSLLSRFTLSKTNFEKGGDSTDSTLLLKVSWFISDLDSLYTYVSYGNGSYRVETRDMIGNIKAKIAGIGGVYFFRDYWGLSPSFEFQERGGGTRYYQFGLELSYRF